MWTKSPLLKKFEKLKELGFPLIREAGTKISRGYADLGYEEFLLLNEDQMISLFSGKVSSLPSDHHQYFFTVLSIDDMTEVLVRAGADIVSLQYVDQRKWSLTLSKNKVESIHGGNSLEEVFTTALLKLYELKSYA